MTDTNAILASKLWACIHEAIKAMPTAELVDRLRVCATRPETVQPTLVRDAATPAEAMIWWGGSPLASIDAEWLLDDTDLVMPVSGERIDGPGDFVPTEWTAE